MATAKKPAAKTKSKAKEIDLKVTEVTATYGITVNMGNFQSMKMDVMMSAQVQEGQNVDEVHEALNQQCLNRIEDTFDACVNQFRSVCPE